MGDRRAIPCGQVRVLGAEDDPDASREATLFGFDDVADAFVDAPLTLGGMP